MAYNTEKCYNLKIEDIEVINSDKQFKKILKWCKATIKDTTRWSIHTHTVESKLPKTKCITISTERFIRFHKKEDHVLYKLSCQFN